jgi:hypothetical protein
MTFHVAQSIFERIDATKLVDLKRDLYRAAQRYTTMRVEWRLAPTDDRPGMDAARTRSHEALIDSVNILSREKTRCGEDNSWRRMLGEDRKKIGDLAAHLVLFLALSAR